MNAFAQSPFLQALGYAIINSLWQFALLWLFYFGISSLFKLSSTQKYSTALLLQLTGFTWFFVTIAFYYKQCSNNLVNYSGEYFFSLSSIDGNTFKEKVLWWLLKAETFLPYLSIAYLLLVVAFTIRWLHSYQRTNKIKTAGIQKIPVDWRLFVRTISYQLGIKRSVEIYLSELVFTPLTIGFLKPVILIPLATINHLSVDQLEAVILHELAHIKRHDYLINLLLSVIETILFFNPFMQLICKHLKRERENCCDDWVLQYKYNAATYARALLTIATLQPNKASLAMAATSDKAALLTRVKRMIEKRERSFHYQHQLFALLLLTTIFCSVGLFSPKKKTREISKKINAEPLTAKVDNPLFNPVFFLANKDLEKNKPVREMQQILKTIDQTKLVKLSSHNIPLAEKQLELNLSKVEIPNLKIASLTNNFFSPLREDLSQLDTAALNKNVRIFTRRIVSQLTRKEKDIAGNLTKVLEAENFENVQSLVDKQKVLRALNIALAEIKATKARLAKEPILAKNRSSRGSIASAVEPAETVAADQAAALSDAEQQIQQKLLEVQQKYYELTRRQQAESINVPVVEEKIIPAHSYSFEYSDIPKATSISVTPLTYDSLYKQYDSLMQYHQSIAPKASGEVRIIYKNGKRLKAVHI